MTPRANSEGSSHGMLKRDPNVNSCQAAQMVGTEVSRPAPVMVVLGGRQAIVKVGHRAPRVLTSLFDTALSQGPCDELNSLLRFVVVVAGKNHRCHAGPYFR